MMIVNDYVIALCIHSAVLSSVTLEYILSTYKKFCHETACSVIPTAALYILFTTSHDLIVYNMLYRLVA